MGGSVCTISSRMFYSGAMPLGWPVTVTLFSNLKITRTYRLGTFDLGAFLAGRSCLDFFRDDPELFQYEAQLPLDTWRKHAHKVS